MAAARFFLIPALALAAALAVLFTASAAPAQDPGVPQSYVVQKGDTKESIARKFYGKRSLGTKLWNANKNLVAHPNRLTPGDTIYIFPESALELNKPVEVPPRPAEPPRELYPRERLLQTAFPQYFSFVADPRGQGGTGLTRIHVRKLERTREPDPQTGEMVENPAGRLLDRVYEVHEAGEIIASNDRGFPMDDDYFNRSNLGRLLLSTGDIVVVRFTEDITKFLDSQTYEDFDPYFSLFPIYGMESVIQGPNRDRPDYGASLGQIFKYRGNLNIVARVEGLAPSTSMTSNRAKRSSKNNQDISTSSYVAKIVYSEDAMNIGDKLFVFVETDPGVERRLDSPYTEPPDTYVSPGK
ncbi:MAG: LysM peptidoglycan-binding domain-containing protein [Deltaproteobacteria bacterium]|nr:LysM peptidoglycan-binding domain-containing protein [Deltaproteobacteria bacterium]